MARRTYKFVTATTTVSNALSSYSGIEEIRQEMTDWRDNMDAAEMSHMPKYEEVEACCEVLDTYDELESAITDLEQLINEQETHMFLLNREVNNTEMVPYKGRGYPRWMQLANSSSPVVDAAQSLVEWAEEMSDDENEFVESVRDGAQEILDHCETLDGAEFPGMF